MSLSIDEKFSVDKGRGSNFLPFIIVSLAIFTIIGFWLLHREIEERKIALHSRKIIASFEIKEPPKPIEKPKPKPKVKPKPKPKVVYDLTKPVQLKAKVDKIVKPKETPPKKVRKIYGVKKVYSKGLGSGGSMSDAVTSKVGNTTNKSYDTLTAKESDLKGEVVSAVTVTKAPRFKKRVKAKITKEIRESGVSGVVKVKVLVDIDGKVKRAIAKNDLGFGTKESAIAACLQMEFTPAYRKKEAVAVWITIPVRFEKI